MIRHFPTARPAERVVENYIETRGRSTVPIYMSHAIRAIRTALPACGLSDRELTNLVAMSAIRSGNSVAFDGPR